MPFGTNERKGPGSFLRSSPALMYLPRFEQRIQGYKYGLDVWVR